MKTREDFVTNSSSSSFIITNKSNEYLTSREVVEKLFEKILKDAEGRFELAPGESISYECGDHDDDGAFENFIHNEFSSWWHSDLYESDGITIEFGESHH
jgi:hypothetical protein